MPKNVNEAVLEKLETSCNNLTIVGGLKTRKWW